VGPRILVVDNYDSFVYNLVQYLGELGADPVVHRHDEVTLDEMDHVARGRYAVEHQHVGPPGETGRSSIAGVDRGREDATAAQGLLRQAYAVAQRRRSGAAGQEHDTGWGRHRAAPAARNDWPVA